MNVNISLIVVWLFVLSVNAASSVDGIHHETVERAGQEFSKLPGFDYRGSGKVHDVETIDFSIIAFEHGLSAGKVGIEERFSNAVVYRIDLKSNPFDLKRNIEIVIFKGGKLPKDAREAFLEYESSHRQKSFMANQFKVLEKGVGDFCFVWALGFDSATGQTRGYVYAFRDNVGFRIHSSGDTDLLRIARAIDVQLQQNGVRKASSLVDANEQEGAEFKQCQKRLNLLASFKENYAFKNKRKLGESISAEELQSFMKNRQTGESLLCPAGGEYYIGDVGETPACSIHGNVLDGHKVAKKKQ